MQLNNTTYHTFPSGLRLVYRQVDSPVAYLGIMVGAGTRDELPEETGMAHYIEHCVFKGTQHRSSRQIIRRIEDVGGEINAYTTKEETTYYVAAPVAYSARSLELLADMIFCPVFPLEETRKERQVIYDEIESYNDSPSELIYDDFESLVFSGHPLANPILGTKKTLRYFNAERAHAFMHRTYRPERMVVFAEASMPASQFVRIAAKYVENQAVRTADSLSVSYARIPFSPASENEIHAAEYRKHTHQAHVMLGGRAYPLAHERQLALYLLNHILGGGPMSSLLNLSLREQKGLVYTVESIYTPLSDTGYWSVYFACDPGDREKCLALVNSQLDLLMDKPLSDALLKRAKCQLRGLMAIAAGNRENNALAMAKSMLYRGYSPQWEETLAIIDTLSAEDINAAAREIFSLENRFCLQYC